MIVSYALWMVSGSILLLLAYVFQQLGVTH